MNSDIKSQLNTGSGFQFQSDLGKIITSLIDVAIVAAAIATLLYLILGGINWITSGGDKQKTEEAQKTITNAIIGLALIAAAYAIFRLINSFLGLDITP